MTGAIEGAGGIHALQALFPKKHIVSFRAPGYCWSPPHLDALKTFGISYDFSAKLSSDLIAYRDVTFYPYPLFPDDWRGGFRKHLHLQKFIMKRKVSVLTIHPSKLVNTSDWDLIYYSKFNGGKLNPEKLIQLPARNPAEISCLFDKFELLLKHLRYLQRINVLTVTSPLKKANSTLHPAIVDVENYYKFSVKWATEFGTSPISSRSFVKFFEEHSPN